MISKTKLNSASMWINVREGRKVGQNGPFKETPSSSSSYISATAEPISNPISIVMRI